MSELHTLVPTDDIGSTLKEITEKAKHCWLSPPEICIVLHNYIKFAIAREPRHKPKGGSLFLFDRNMLRFFRDDGHSWRKRKDGKGVMETHRKLKAGDVKVLECYNAYGEDNFFQRRCYWLLEEEWSRIVLVHYQEVKGNRANFNRVKEVGEAIPNSQDIEVVPHSEVDTPLSSKFNLYRCQVAPQTTNIASLASSQASQYADAKSARNYPSSSGFHSLLESQSCVKEQKNGELSGSHYRVPFSKEPPPNLSQWGEFLVRKYAPPNLSQWGEFLVRKYAEGVQVK